MDTSAGMYKAFLSLACPILDNLGFPLIDDPDSFSRGASPIKATISRTWLIYPDHLILPRAEGWLLCLERVWNSTIPLSL